MKNFGSQILLHQLKGLHEALEGTMEGVTDEVAQWQPAGTANPIAGTYAHLVFSEDFFMQHFLRKVPMLFDSTFKDKTGASEVQPTDWVEAYPKWLREVKLDVAQFREYARAVYAASEEYIGSMTDEQLQQDVDMSEFGMGSRQAYDFIANMINGHVGSIMGEIAVLKGIQGLKGYPF